MSSSRAIQMALPFEWLTARGLLSLKDLWNQLPPVNPWGIHPAVAN